MKKKQDSPVVVWTGVSTSTADDNATTPPIRQSPAIARRKHPSWIRILPHSSVTRSLKNTPVSLKHQPLHSHCLTYTVTRFDEYVPTKRAKSKKQTRASRELSTNREERVGLAEGHETKYARITGVHSVHSVRCRVGSLAIRAEAGGEVHRWAGFTSSLAGVGVVASLTFHSYSPASRRILHAHLATGPATRFYRLFPLSWTIYRRLRIAFPRLWTPTRYRGKPSLAAPHTRPISLLPIFPPAVCFDRGFLGDLASVCKLPRVSFRSLSFFHDIQLVY